MSIGLGQSETSCRMALRCQIYDFCFSVWDSWAAFRIVCNIVVSFQLTNKILLIRNMMDDFQPLEF